MQSKAKSDTPLARPGNAVIEMGQSIQMDQFIQMEQFIQGRTVRAIADLGGLQRALVMAETVGKLRPFIKSQLPLILPLVGNRLGFLTDRDKPRKGQPQQPYPHDVIVDCCCEALIRGLFLTGNEFNIIGGGCMTVKNGWARLIQEHPDVTDFDPAVGIPALKQGGVIVPCEASWRMKGTSVKIRREYVLKQEPYTSLDALMGKAERRLFRDSYFRMTGSATWAEPDDEGQLELPGDQVDSRTAQLAGRITQQSGGLTLQSPPSPPRRATLLSQLTDTLRHFGYTEEEFQQEVSALGVSSPDKLTDDQMERLIAKIVEANSGEVTPPETSASGADNPRPS